MLQLKSIEGGVLMSRNNIKLLSKEQLKQLNRKYYFEADDENIIVKLYNYNRITFHSKIKPFHINCKIRKVCFSMEAINAWLKLYDQKEKYSLFDVQQAANILTITYQTVDENSIIKQLKKGE